MENYNKDNKERSKNHKDDFPKDLLNEEMELNPNTVDNLDSEETKSIENEDIIKKVDDTEEMVEEANESHDEETEEKGIVEERSFEEQIREHHRNLIEASLYAAGSPLTIEEISIKLDFSKKEVEELINELAFDYLDRSTALIIAQIGDRYQMQLKPEYTEEVSKFAKGGAIAERYLRTLTVIALKQPILKSVLVKIRGTGAYEHVKYLIDNGFLNAVKKGRTHQLTTTDKYADMFGLPKDKHQLKQAMIAQLGIEEGQTSSQPEEKQGEDKIEQE